MIISVGLTKSGRNLAWNYCKSNWSKISERFSGFLLTRLIKYLTENFSTDEMANDVTTFFNEHKAPGAERTIQQAVETIHLNSEWLKRDLESIKKYLA